MINLHSGIDKCNPTKSASFKYDEDCCTSSNPCGEKEGGCSSNDECGGALVCSASKSSCGSDFATESGETCCHVQGQ